jgi:hypothetical protein
VWLAKRYAVVEGDLYHQWHPHAVHHPGRGLRLARRDPWR